MVTKQQPSGNKGRDISLSHKRE